MRLSSMRFKDYTWPHNPETFVMEYRREVAAHKVPQGGCVLQDLGVKCRVLRGEGVFVGAEAYEEFRALARVFEEEGPGMLVHPVWRTDRAYFVSLSVTEEPRPDYVRYSFVFWEDNSGYDGGLTVSDNGGSGGTDTATLLDAAPAEAAEQTAHTVRQGDTLWGIARRYRVELAALISANPWIKNPNLIHPGDEVVIP